MCKLLDKTRLTLIMSLVCDCDLCTFCIAICFAFSAVTLLVERSQSAKSS